MREERSRAYIRDGRISGWCGSIGPGGVFLSRESGMSKGAQEEQFVNEMFGGKVDGVR